MPAEDDEFRDHGSNVGRLVPTDVEYDPITGLPRQGNIPVKIAALDAVPSTEDPPLGTQNRLPRR